MEDKKEELLNLVTSGADRIEKARQAFIDACLEENQKVRVFFDENKDEMVLPMNALIGEKSYYYQIKYGRDSVDSELLTRNFKFVGYKKGFFYISNDIKLDKNTIEQISFLSDDEKELFNEVVVPSASSAHKLAAGRYAVIIYPKEYDNTWGFNNLKDYIHVRPNDTFAIYIGKIMHYGIGRVFMKDPESDRDSKKRHFEVRSEFLKDFRVFDTPEVFNAYVSKHDLSNGVPTDLEKLPEK